jgi:exodeoxyribonuclease VII large subunit
LKPRRPFNPDLIEMPTEEKPRSSGAAVVSVSELTRKIKNVIGRSFPESLHVVGEVSNFKRHSSGHLYFTLKDEKSELSCVMWRSAGAELKFDPMDGLEVVATGKVEVYERSGRYQLYVRKLEPRGVGALELAFRQLCEKLEKEGLFDNDRKQPLPAFPRRIALVTSPTGAAVRDMLHTLRRRFGRLCIFVYPVRVQGDQASGEIASAITQLNRQAERLGGIDLMIVGRGGGSLEDLWAFNQEQVVRAIFASRIPVISAVGHEVDVTISDLVADVRAATPTAAAELAVPLLDDVLSGLSRHSDRLSRSMRQRVELSKALLARLVAAGPLTRPLDTVRQRLQTVDEVTTKLRAAVGEQWQHVRFRLHRCEVALAKAHPRDVFERRLRLLMAARHRLLWALGHASVVHDRRLQQAVRHLVQTSPIHQARSGHSALHATQHRLNREQTLMLQRFDTHLEDIQTRLEAGSHQMVLRRGFSLTFVKKGRKLIHSRDTVKDGMRILTETRDGHFESEVVDKDQMTLFGDPA